MRGSQAGRCRTRSHLLLAKHTQHVPNQQNLCLAVWLDTLGVVGQQSAGWLGHCNLSLSLLLGLCIDIDARLSCMSLGPDLEQALLQQLDCFSQLVRGSRLPDEAEEATASAVRPWLAA